MKDLLKIKQNKTFYGKTVRVNLRISKEALQIFDEIKKRQNYKINAEIFEYINKLINELDLAQEIKKISSEGKERNTRKIFTVNKETISKLRKTAKELEISVDELVNHSLITIDRAIKGLKKYLKAQKKSKQYTDKNKVLKIIDNILDQLTELQYGLEIVLPQQDYDADDPDNLPHYFAHIQGQLDELQEAINRLFDQQRFERIRDNE